MAQVIAKAVNDTLNAGNPLVGFKPQYGLVNRIIEASSVSTVLLTLFLGAVVYDQCELISVYLITANQPSHVHLSQRQNRGRLVQDPFYWPVSRIRQSEIS
jgi:hypothetical protein